MDDESDDLYLTDVGFVKEWLPKVCGDLGKLSISDFWIQSCWRKSLILSLISSRCEFLGTCNFIFFLICYFGYTIISLKLNLMESF